jgi:UDP-N-acetylmuramate dehydrogenase
LIFVEAIFHFEKGDPTEIKAKMDKISEERKLSQPVTQKTGGSTFANPEGHKAWQLIDEAGMRGHIIGGAQVSPMHCNFMINMGNATATDLESLGDLVRKKVLEKSGIDLHWEIKRIGSNTNSIF